MRCEGKEWLFFVRSERDRQTRRLYYQYGPRLVVRIRGESCQVSSLFKLLCFAHAAEQVGDISPTAHLQVLGDPFQTHRRFLPQPRRQPHLPFIPFADLTQRPRVPTHSLQLLPNHPLRFGLLRFAPFRPSMAGPHLSRRRLQQFLPKLLAAQTPSPLYRLEFRSQIFPPPLFGQPGKLFASRRAVLGDAFLPQQPVHPQPGRPLPGRLEVISIAAPGKRLQRLPALEQSRPRRIQMHIVAHRPQIAIAAPLDEQLV